MARALPQLQELSLLGIGSGLGNVRRPSLQHWAAAYGHFRHLRSIRVAYEVITALDTASDPASALDRLLPSQLSVLRHDKELESRMNAFAKVVADHCPELQEILFCYDAEWSILRRYIKLPGGGHGVYLA